MKRIFVWLGIFCVLAYLTGCIQVDTIIKVKPDGSGTVEETFLMNKEFIKQMQDMMEQMVGQMGVKPPEGQEGGKGFDILDEGKLRKKADLMGSGVTYVSAKRVNTGWGEGYHAVYSFRDINNLKVNQNPGESVPDSPGTASQEGTGSEEYVLFQFTKGSPATLTIRMPQEKATKETKPPPREHKKEEVDDAEVPDDPEDADEAEAAMQMEQMKAMFKDMKIGMAVEVEGSIVKTDAAYREGSRITLMEMDFSQLVNNQKKLEKLSESEPETVEQAKELMKDIPGVKIEFNEKVKVSFK